MKARVTLVEAARNNDLDSLKAIIASGLDDIHSVDTTGRSALFFACSLGSIQMIDALLDAKADINTSYNSQSPIMYAARDGNLECVKGCIQNANLKKNEI